MVLDDLDQIKKKLSKIEYEMSGLKEQIEKKADKKWVEKEVAFLEKELLQIKQALKG